MAASGTPRKSETTAASTQAGGAFAAGAAISWAGLSPVNPTARITPPAPASSRAAVHPNSRSFRDEVPARRPRNPGTADTPTTNSVANTATTAGRNHAPSSVAAVFCVCTTRAARNKWLEMGDFDKLMQSTSAASPRARTSAKGTP
jgi:hypothetical protein